MRDAPEVARHEPELVGARDSHLDVEVASRDAVRGVPDDLDRPLDAPPEDEAEDREDDDHEAEQQEHQRQHAPSDLEHLRRVDVDTDEGPGAAVGPSDGGVTRDAAASAVVVAVDLFLLRQLDEAAHEERYLGRIPRRTRLIRRPRGGRKRPHINNGYG